MILLPIYHVLTSGNQVSAQIEASPLPTGIYGARRYYTDYQRRKVIITLIQLQTLQPITATCQEDISTGATVAHTL